MKIFYWGLICCIFSSCAQKTIRAKFDSIEKDPFHGQVLARLGSGAIESIQASEENELNKLVLACYKGDVKRTIDELKNRYFSHQNDVHFWHAIAQCHHYQGDLNQSQYYLKIALNKAKQNKALTSVILNNIALNSWKKGEMWKAYKYLKEASVIDSSNRVVNFNLGLFLLSSQKIELAKKHLELFKSDLSDPDINSAFLFVSICEKDWNNAVLLSQKVSKTDLTRADIGTYLAIALFNLKKWDEALAVLNQIKSSNLHSFTQKQKQLKTEIEKIIEEREVELKRMAVK